MAESYSERMSRLERLARRAIGAYDASDIRLHFLGHSENITFRLEIGGGALQRLGPLRDVPVQYLLRIHTPIHLLRSDRWNHPEAIRSELMWLEALGRDTELRVPTPVANAAGEMVSRVNFDEDDPQSMVNATILQWIEGQHLTSDLQNDQAYLLGQMVAQLHVHSLEWSLPDDFVRPEYDPETIDASIDTLQRLAKHERVIRFNDFELLESVAKRIKVHIKNLGEASRAMGLIHGDLHETNYLFERGAFSPIDFSSCGFGYFLFDIGYALRHILPAHRSAFLDGYHSVRSLSGCVTEDLEAFMIWGSLANFAFHAPLHKNYEFLSRAVPYLARNHCHRFMRDERFLMIM